MSAIHKYLATAVMISAFTVLSGCTVYPAHRHHHDEGYGPPPHAPAHGYRHKYRGHELVYDSHLGVYVVIGLHDHYYYDNYFYKYDHDHWRYSHDVDRDWHDYKNGHLPPGLAKKHGKSNKEKGRKH